MTRALRIRVVINLCANGPDHATFANAKTAHMDQTANVSKSVLVNLLSLLTNTMLCKYQLLKGNIIRFTPVVI